MIAIAALLVAVFGISLLQFQNSVRAPFARRGEAPKSIAAQEAELLAAQKSADTDGDGLSDFDELNVYQTSPYIDDTDSDGYKDGDEVASNHDPNCPAGKSCGGESAASPSSAPPILPNLPPTPTIETFIGGTPEALQRFDAPTIRSLLRGAGVSEDLLRAIDDETLRQIYEQTIASSSPEIQALRATSTRE